MSAPNAIRSLRDVSVTFRQAAGLRSSTSVMAKNNAASGKAEQSDLLCFISYRRQFVILQQVGVPHEGEDR